MPRGSTPVTMGETGVSGELAGLLGASISWVSLGQCAQAAKDHELLQVTKECHPDTLRTLKWINTKTKETSLQVLMS